MTATNSMITDLRDLLGAEVVVSDPGALPAYGQDFLENRGIPGVVVRARSVDDVIATLRYAAARGIAVVPRAAGTNVAAAFLPSPERIMLDLRDMNRIRSLDAERRLAVVQPGVLNGDLNRHVAPAALCFSPDPASYEISTIGGNIATNAGGPHCLKYGATVQHVEAVSVVLADGHLLTLTAGCPGPDLLGVIVGSEGTLGVVTEATVRLRSLPELTRTLLAVFDRAEDAVEAVSATIAAGLVPAAIEFFDRTMAAILEAYAPSGYPTDADAILLIDVDGSADEVGEQIRRVEAILRRRAREVRRADDEAARDALWHGRRLAAIALTAGERAVYFGDVTVPRERLPDLARAVRAVATRRNLTIVNVGHIGDGNVHPTVLYDPADPTAYAAARAADDEIVAVALSLGGTLTGEHGVGSAKRAQMRTRFTAAEIAAMRAVKQAFDPAGLLNPGILLPDHTSDEPPLVTFTVAVQAAVRTVRGMPVEPVAPNGDAAADPYGEALLDAANLTVTAPAGISLATLQSTLARSGFRTPLPAAAMPLSEAILQAPYRAAIQDALLAVRARTDGVAVRFGSNAVKDVAGYDLKRLYIGSGGAFGQIDEATLRITPQ